MENNRNQFILEYGKPLMDGGPLQKYLVTLAYTTSEDKVL